MTNTIAAPALEVKPVRADYRTLPIDQGFDWPYIIGELGAERDLDLSAAKLYAVAFYSKRRQIADPLARAALDREIAAGDKAAYEEAKAADDPVWLYFAGEVSGKPDAEFEPPDIEPGLAMSVCIWPNRGAAKAALRGTAHAYPASQVDRYYEHFDVRLHDVYVSRPAPEEPLQVTFQPLHNHRGRH